jgi:hypothetical protein
LFELQDLRMDLKGIAVRVRAWGYLDPTNSGRTALVARAGCGED